MFGIADHQSRRTSSFVHASNTRSRGAANRRWTCTTIPSRVATLVSFREMALDRVELRLPEPPVRLEPRLGVRERTPAQAEPMGAALDPPRDHAGVLEHAQVLRDGGLRDPEPGGRLADGRRPGREPLDDRAADGMGEGEEAAIELRRTVHLEVYNSAMTTFPNETTEYREGRDALLSDA